MNCIHAWIAPQWIQGFEKIMVCKRCGFITKRIGRLTFYQNKKEKYMDETNYEIIIERIVNHSSDDLNTWESEFMESVYGNHVVKKNSLTEKQKKKILDINGKVLGR